MARRPPRSYDADSRSDPDFPWLERGEFFRFPDPEDACGTVETDERVEEGVLSLIRQLDHVRKIVTLDV